VTVLTSNPTDAYASAFERLEWNRRTPPWVVPLRHAAIARFAELGFPTTRNEDWKYTDVSSIAQTWWHLLIFRFLSALGVGGEWAVGSSLLAETWPRSWRPWFNCSPGRAGGDRPDGRSAMIPWCSPLASLAG
jgi:MFS family permease